MLLGRLARLPPLLPAILPPAMLICFLVTVLVSNHASDSPRSSQELVQRRKWQLRLANATRHDRPRLPTPTHSALDASDWPRSSQEFAGVEFEGGNGSRDRMRPTNATRHDPTSRGSPTLPTEPLTISKQYAEDKKSLANPRQLSIGSEDLRGG